MQQKGLSTFFQNFLRKESLFIDKKALQSSYTPETIPHRQEQIEQVAKILAPCLKVEKPSNLFIYGKTGTGKTLTVKYTTDSIMDLAVRENIPINVYYVNCKLKKVADTEYRLLAQIIRDMGVDIPPTGLPTEEVYKIFFDVLDKKDRVILLILDEIDQLVKKIGDEVLYNLTRINTELKHAQLSIIGISNDLIFTDSLDPRVKSSLSEEELVFPPYNALQIQDILMQRSRIAFREGTIEQGVVEKCAAYAASHHGDARRALELLRIAGEIAERNGFPTVKIEHIDEAEEKIDKDKIVDVVNTQPKQFQAVLYAILTIYKSRQKFMFTGEAYDIYKEICFKTNLRPLTQRRVSDILSELDMLGIISTKVISKGRYGRTREISMNLSKSTEALIRKILENSLSA